MIKVLLLVKSFVFIALLCVCFNVHAQINTKSLSKKKWVLVESDNFKIYTDSREKKARIIAEQLEGFRAFSLLYLNVKSKSKSKSNGRKTVMFSTDKASTWKAMGMNKDYVSIYKHTKASESYIFSNMNGFFGSSFKKANYGRSVLLNAVSQELFNDIGLSDSYPYWFKTGLAYYLATYSEPKDRIMLGSLEAYEGRLSTMVTATGTIIPFDTKALFARSKGIKRKKGKPSNDWNSKVNQLYMTSFLTVHYLYADETRRKEMADYLSRVQRGESKDEAFQAAFELSYAEFDSRLRKYVTGRNLSARVLSKEGVTKLLKLAVDYQVTKLDKGPFFKDFALAISELGSTSISREHRAKLVSDLKQLHPEIFGTKQAL